MVGMMVMVRLRLRKKTDMHVLKKHACWGKYLQDCRIATICSIIVVVTRLRISLSTQH